MDELEKLLATRPDARVAVIGSQQDVSKYVGETEQNIAAAFVDAERAHAILFVDEADDLFGRREDISAHDGPVVFGVRSLDRIPKELRRGVVAVKAPHPRWWQRVLP